MTRTWPNRFIILHFMHIFLTDVLTFTCVASRLAPWGFQARTLLNIFGFS
jgi:hypothetical protein